MHTGMRVGGWTVEANERVVLEPGPLIGYKNATLLSTAAAFAAGHQTVGGFLRATLLEAPSLEAALPLLASTPLASPMYLIVGGLSTSTVLTRGRAGPANVSQDTSVLGRQVVPAGGAVANLTDRMGEWYQVQTNWDRWVPTTASACRDAMANFVRPPYPPAAVLRRPPCSARRRAPSAAVPRPPPCSTRCARRRLPRRLPPAVHGSLAGRHGRLCPEPQRALQLRLGGCGDTGAEPGAWRTAERARGALLRGVHPAAVCRPRQVRRPLPALLRWPPRVRSNLFC
eukprot:SAG11_NODE_2707_length_3064_cov_1.595278_3_plen_285_part_00